jgi:Hydrolase of X-linked nucleoside diphosphate N terminal
MRFVAATEEESAISAAIFYARDPYDAKRYEQIRKTALGDSLEPPYPSNHCVPTPPMLTVPEANFRECLF